VFDNQVTLVGNVATSPDHKIVTGGVALTRFRVASTQRRFDRGSGEWRDGPTTFLSVTCWRRLAEHVADCVRRGDPVVVTGRLVGRSYDADGQERYVVELEASSVGLDLARARVEARRSPDATAPPPAGDGIGAGGDAEVAADRSAA
jgi:single-strand DNA-binding protein